MLSGFAFYHWNSVEVSRNTQCVLERIDIAISGLLHNDFSVCVSKQDKY